MYLSDLFPILLASYLKLKFGSAFQNCGLLTEFWSHLQNFGHFHCIFFALATRIPHVEVM